MISSLPASLAFTRSQAAPGTASQTAATEPAPSPAPAPGDDTFLGGVKEAVKDVVSVAAGTLGGAIGVIANGSAGGALGMMRGAQLEGTPAAAGFQVAFAANLLLAGGLAYGAGSAVSTLVAGQTTWRTQGEACRQETREMVERTLDAALSFFPPTDHPTSGRLLGQAAAGEVVGFAAGAVVGGRNGYLVGAALGEKAVDYVAEKVRGAVA